MLSRVPRVGNVKVGEIGGLGVGCWSWRGRRWKAGADQLPKSLEKNPFFGGNGGGGAELGGSGGGVVERMDGGAGVVLEAY